MPWDKVEPIWPLVEPLIQKAIDRGQGEYEAGDILAFLLSRDMQLWVSDDLEAAAVTQIIVYPRRKVCSVLLVGGCGLHQWKNTKVIETWAAAQGCELMRAHGRRGWHRAVGWQEVYTVAEKRL